MGNCRSNTSTGLTTLAARDGRPNWDELVKLLEEWQPERLLVGLPLNMDDSESEMSANARRFAKQLRGRFDLPVELVDERLSTRVAHERLTEAGASATQRRQSIDQLSAKLVLDDWFNWQQHQSGR